MNNTIDTQRVTKLLASSYFRSRDDLCNATYVSMTLLDFLKLMKNEHRLICNTTSLLNHGCGRDRNHIRHRISLMNAIFPSSIRSKEYLAAQVSLHMVTLMVYVEYLRAITEKWMVIQDVHKCVANITTIVTLFDLYIFIFREELSGIMDSRFVENIIKTTVPSVVISDIQQEGVRYIVNVPLHIVDESLMNVIRPVCIFQGLVHIPNDKVCDFLSWCLHRWLNIHMHPTCTYYRTLLPNNFSLFRMFTYVLFYMT